MEKLELSALNNVCGGMMELSQRSFLDGYLVKVTGSIGEYGIDTTDIVEKVDVRGWLAEKTGSNDTSSWSVEKYDEDIADDCFYFKVYHASKGPAGISTIAKAEGRF